MALATEDRTADERYSQLLARLEKGAQPTHELLDQLDEAVGERLAEQWDRGERSVITQLLGFPPAEIDARLDAVESRVDAMAARLEAINTRLEAS